MRIAWFHSHLLHANSGGTRFVVENAIGLKENFKHEITIFCDCSDKELIVRFKDAGILVVLLDSISTNHFFYWLTIPVRNYKKRKMLKFIERDFDCIINSMFPMNMLVSKFNIPKIQICYEPFAFFYDSGFLKNFTIPQQIFFNTMKLFYQNADIYSSGIMDELITINKSNIDKIIKIYKREPKVVYAGINTDMYHRSPVNDIVELRKVYFGKPLLFHSTDLTGIKGTFPLLEIINVLRMDFPEIKLLVTVYVNLSEGINLLKDKIKELKLENNIEYLGCLPVAKLPLMYSSVDFVCQPSLNQPANWPLKEALLCGTPIIGGKESEEVNSLNGVKINVNDHTQSVAILKELFRKPKADFVVENETLINEYSMNACLKKLNYILSEYEN